MQKERIERFNFVLSSISWPVHLIHPVYFFHFPFFRLVLVLSIYITLFMSFISRVNDIKQNAILHLRETTTTREGMLMYIYVY